MRYSAFKALTASALVLAAVCLASCRRQAEPARPTIAFVKAVMARTSGTPYGLVEEYDASASSGAIYIIGPAERTALLRDALIGCDRFDNVDGSLRPDYLPDFAGETIASVADIACTPYSRFVESGDSLELREVVVKSVLASLDTLAYLSPYDLDGGARRAPAKLVVLASPYMSAFGKFDLDTLFESFGVGNPVIGLADEMFAAALDGAKDDINIAVASIPGEGADSLLYSGIAGCPCTILPADTTMQDPIRNLLDLYATISPEKPLDVLLVDNPALDVDAMRASADSLLSVMNRLSLVYRPLVSDSFRIIGASETVEKVIFKRLRETNAFTHRIAYPAAASYNIYDYRDRYVQDEHPE